MTRRYRLTPEVAKGIELLASLRTVEVRALAQELERRLTVKLAIDEELAALIRESSLGKEKSSEEHGRIAEAITGVHLLRVSSPKRVDDVVADIIDAFKDFRSEADTSALRENLALILNVKVLQASTKAWTLIGDHDTIYLASRIITDLRPVFDEDLEQPLNASLVTHTIKLTVRTEGKSKPVYVVADGSDLKELRDSIDRALAKGAAVTKMVSNHPGHWFGTSIGEDHEND